MTRAGLGFLPSTPYSIRCPVQARIPRGPLSYSRRAPANRVRRLQGSYGDCNREALRQSTVQCGDTVSSVVSAVNEYAPTRWCLTKMFTHAYPPLIRRLGRLHTSWSLFWHAPRDTPPISGGMSSLRKEFGLVRWPGSGRLGVGPSRATRRAVQSLARAEGSFETCAIGIVLAQPMVMCTSADPRLIGEWPDSPHVQRDMTHDNNSEVAPSGRNKNASWRGISPMRPTAKPGRYPSHTFVVFETPTMRRTLRPQTSVGKYLTRAQ